MQNCCGRGVGWNGLRAGQLLPLNIAVLQVAGYAHVTAIGPCPPIAGGEGSVVTARFVTRQVDVIARIEVLGADGRVETIEGTTIHPIWSLDRNDWVPLGELEAGEQLLDQAGPALVLSHAILQRSLPVYNIEVHGQHVYEVGELGVLVHNNCVVLGEGMDAVKSAARGANAKWYQAWGKNFPKDRPMTSTELQAALDRNERWIRQKAKDGYQFLDIGIDPTRSIRSPFYELERRVLKELGIATIPLPR